MKDRNEEMGIKGGQGRSVANVSTSALTIKMSTQPTLRKLWILLN
jgi:hypothetical protein